MGFGDVQGVVGLVKSHEWMLLTLIALGFVVFLFVRKWWSTFVKSTDRLRQQVDLIYNLQLELAEVTDLDITARKDIVSHRDLLEKVVEWHKAQMGENRVSRTELYQHVTDVCQALHVKLDKWIEELGQHCTIANCPHRAEIEATEKELASEIRRQAEAMNQIVKDNKEIGNELVAFAGSLLEVIAKRNGVHNGAPGSNR